MGKRIYLSAQEWLDANFSPNNKPSIKLIRSAIDHGELEGLYLRNKVFVASDALERLNYSNKDAPTQSTTIDRLNLIR